MANTDRELAHLAARVGKRLRRCRLTLCTAESCTGGWISKALTDISGSSDWFSEGFVTYSNHAKHATLGVSAADLIRYGAVSRNTARSMAQGALRRSKADIAIAVTGIAGPGGAVLGKPVGTVWLAWAFRRKKSIRVVLQLKHFRGDREAVRRKTVRVAMQGLLTIPT